MKISAIRAVPIYTVPQLRATLPALPKVTNFYFAPLPSPFHSLLPFLKFPVALRVKLDSPAQLCLLIRGLESSPEPFFLENPAAYRALHDHSGFSQVLPPLLSLTHRGPSQTRPSWGAVPGVTEITGGTQTTRMRGFVKYSLG